AEVDARRADARDAARHIEEVVEARRRTVAPPRLHDRQAATPRLELAIGEPERPEQLDARHLEVAEEVRVVDDPERVRLLVSDANHRRPGRRRATLSGWRTIFARPARRHIYISVMTQAHGDTARRAASSSTVRFGRTIDERSSTSPIPSWNQRD